MKKGFLLLWIALIFFPQFLLAQGGWIKHLPAEGDARDLLKAPDGNYTFIRNSSVGIPNGSGPGSYLTKIDPQGDILWSTKVISNYSNYSNRVILSHDNGYLVHSLITGPPGGGITASFLIKFDQYGNQEWSEFYPFDDLTPYTTIKKIIPTQENTYLLIIEEGSLNHVGRHLRKVDADFNEIWTFNIPSDFATHSGYNFDNILEFPNGDIGIHGWYSNYIPIPSEQVRFLMKLDSSTNVLWETDITNLGTTNRLKLHSLSDGGIMAFHHAVGLSDNTLYFKCDNSGNILWYKYLFPNGTLGEVAETRKVNDHFILVGSIHNQNLNTPLDLLIQKIDLDGNTEWIQSINNAPGNDYGGDIFETDNNGFIGIATSSDNYYLFGTDSLGQIHPNKVIGKIAFDEIQDCSVEPNELGIANWILSAKKDNEIYHTKTDEDGIYSLPLDTGDYQISIYPPNAIWSECVNEVDLNIENNSIDTLNFPVEAIVECPLMAISTSFPIARPCFDNNRFYVSYCNEGTQTSENTYIEIELDSDLSYVSSSLNLTSQDGNTLTFSLGNVPIGYCGNFNVDLLVDCELDNGNSLCIDSHIYPDTFCLPVDPNFWNGAFVEVDVECEGSNVQFYIENTGTGDMLQPREYIVVEDAILLIQEDFQLSAGQIDSFSLPSNGSTYTLTAQQVLNAPGNPLPTAWVEGCGFNGSGNFSLGYTNQFSLGDNIPFKDTDCSNATSSFDPNDKQGFPLGYGDEHFIRPNTDLEYLIRFQNTGTDTAFTVVIRDTIAPELDIPSIQIGASSHPMEWRIYGENVLEFTFNVIMLPDSNVNEPASHGFVEFKISQKENLPLGTVIKNKAAIYFDYNDPIITNETFHTLGENFITVSTQRPIEEDYSLLVKPNPLQEYAIFEMKKEIKNGFFELYDVSGKLAYQQKFNGSEFELKRNNLNAGIYFYKISENGNAINSGKIIIN